MALRSFGFGCSGKSRAHFVCVTLLRCVQMRRVVAITKQEMGHSHHSSMAMRRKMRLCLCIMQLHIPPLTYCCYVIGGVSHECEKRRRQKESFFSIVQKGARWLFAASKPTAPWLAPKTSLIIDQLHKRKGNSERHPVTGGLVRTLGPSDWILHSHLESGPFATSTSLFRSPPSSASRRKRPYLFCLLLFSCKRRRNKGRNIGASAKLTITQNDISWIIRRPSIRLRITAQQVPAQFELRRARIVRLCDSGSRREFRWNILPLTIQGESIQSMTRSGGNEDGERESRRRRQCGLGGLK